ncbi:MAG: PIN domain-containing protein [Candidatus Methylacidiphilales bacterium]|nr:PIN domain-containing protein [Candidatus Methylacidiphilales bacterium]
MGILIDSETLLSWAEHPARLEAWMGSRREEECFLSMVTVDELLRAVAETTEGKRRHRRMAFVESALEHLPVLPLDRKTARIHAGIRPGGKAGGKSGEELSDRDGWVAATCLAHGLVLVTQRPEIFRRVPGLVCQAYPGPGRTVRP